MHKLRPKPKERTLLISVYLTRNILSETQESIDELEQLALSAGANVVEKIIVKRSTIKPSYYIGIGKASELSSLCEEENIKLVIFDTDLSPAQLKNLQDVFQIKVIDRTELILDIFAQRAHSKEGCIQVELAQLYYMLPRLTRAWTHLSRQDGAGIGTRGPGEKQLEIDRRRIREKIDRLKKEIKLIHDRRFLRTKRRKRSNVAQVALVGYTNAGKSTLFKTLTNENVFIEDKLFATLDPTTRQLTLSNNQKIFISDSVGFIRNLPHHLVESFKSTLEEIIEADVLIHVLDASVETSLKNYEVVLSVIKELNAKDIPVVTALNKVDLPESQKHINTLLKEIPFSVPISAKDSIGIDDLLFEVERILSARRKRCVLSVGLSEGKDIAFIKETAYILNEEIKDNNIIFEVIIEFNLAGKLKKYMDKKTLKEIELLEKHTI